MVTTITSNTKKQIINSVLKKLQKLISENGIDAYKYCGSIKLIDDPVSIQKECRDEWK
jgi:hypothetical protein